MDSRKSRVLVQCFVCCYALNVLAQLCRMHSNPGPLARIHPTLSPTIHAFTHPRTHPPTHASTHALIHPRTHFPVDLQLSQECKEYRPLYHQIYLNEMPVSDQLQLLQVLCTHYASEAKGYCENPDEALVAMVAGIRMLCIYIRMLCIYARPTHIQHTHNTHATTTTTTTTIRAIKNRACIMHRPRK
jgi:hypothetical protein